MMETKLSGRLSGWIVCQAIAGNAATGTHSETEQAEKRDKAGAAVVVEAAFIAEGPDKNTVGREAGEALVGEAAGFAGGKRAGCAEVAAAGAGHQARDIQLLAERLRHAVVPALGRFGFIA